MDSLYHSPFVFASAQNESCIILDIHTEHPADILRFWGNVSIMPVHLFSTYGRIIPICEFRLLHYFLRKELFHHGRALHGNDRLAHWREAPMPLPLGEVARRNAGTERVFAEHFPSQSRLWRDSSPIGRAKGCSAKRSFICSSQVRQNRCLREKERKGLPKNGQRIIIDFDRFSQRGVP